MNIVQRIVAGGFGRPTRLHTERGQAIPFRELVHLPRVIAAWSRRRITGRRPPEPWWPLPVIPLVAQHLAAHSTVLEFGSGTSTLWLARRAGKVVSVEDNPAWYRRVTDRLAEAGLGNTTIRLAEGADFYDLSWAGASQFDFIVVDGSYRWRCIEAALPRLKPGGILYLDNSDADKDYAQYPRRDMNRVAMSLLEAYAKANPSARLERYVSFISGELHAGEGAVLKIA